MQAAKPRQEIKYQFGALPKGMALDVWKEKASNDFTPVFIMHICENLNGFSKEGYSYKIDDSAIAEVYQVCTRTVQRARAKLINADVVETVTIKKGVFCYRPSKTSTLRRQMCQEKMDKLTDLSRNNQGETMPNSDSHKQSKKTQAAPLEYEKHKTINTNPKTNITKRKTDAKGGEELFKEIKDSLRLSDSNIPTDIEIKELLSEISAKEPAKALVWAIQNCKLGEPIKDLRRFYHSPSTSLSKLISEYVSLEPRIMGHREKRKQSRADFAAARQGKESGETDNKLSKDRVRELGISQAQTEQDLKPGLRQVGSLIQTVQITPEQREEWAAKVEAERNNAPS